MICKDADNKDGAISTLEKLFNTASKDKQALIERELRAMRAGIKGESESAYLLDFSLKGSQTTAVIHDLRIELDDGRVAQIDHLLIHRTYRFYVLETKHFSHGLKITDDGEFLRWNDWKKTFEGMASPIEQNNRHAVVLREAITSLGLSEPTIQSFILIAPHARIDRPKHFNTEMVVKADQFVSALETNLDKSGFFGLLGGLVKTTLKDSVSDIGKKLIALHRPITINYAARFGMTESTPQKVVEECDKETKPSRTMEPPAQSLCRACGSTNLAIQYGKFDYYFKCATCDGNTPIKIECGISGHKERIRKNGIEFYRECAECKSSSLYFTNPV
jgi:hypothetical protein